MIWNGLTDEERLRLWKELRGSLAGADLSVQLNSIAQFCAKMPFGSRTLDYYTPEDWPTPWEILYHGTFCKSSISLLIFYTITFLSPETKVDLYLVEDSDDIFLLPIIDDQFVLNYELGVVSKYLDVKDSFKIRQVFPQGRVKTIK
jgi:hypothetical protein